MNRGDIKEKHILASCFAWIWVICWMGACIVYHLHLFIGGIISLGFAFILGKDLMGDDDDE